MSMALFLNSKKQLSGEELLIINNFFKENKIAEIKLCPASKFLNLDGVSYYFDSMWIPFLRPLSEFKHLESNEYGKLISIFTTIKKAINYLLNGKHSVKLFLASVDDKATLIKTTSKLKFSDIDEFKSFEWGALYEIFY